MTKRDAVYVCVIIALVVALAWVGYGRNRQNDHKALAAFMNTLTQVDSAIEVGTNVTDYTRLVTLLNAEHKKIKQETSMPAEGIYKLVGTVMQIHLDAQDWWRRKADVMSNPLSAPRKEDLEKYTYLDMSLFAFDKFNTACLASTGRCEHRSDRLPPSGFLQTLWLHSAAMEGELRRQLHGEEAR